MVCACTLACAAVGLWIAGGFAVASEAVYPVERSATWFQRHVTCRLRTIWRRQNYGAENAQLRRANDILQMALQESERARAAQGGANDEKPMPRQTWIDAPVLSRGGTTGAKNFLRIGKWHRDLATVHTRSPLRLACGEPIPFNLPPAEVQRRQVDFMTSTLARWEALDGRKLLAAPLAPAPGAC